MASRSRGCLDDERTTALLRQASHEAHMGCIWRGILPTFFPRRSCPGPQRNDVTAMLPSDNALERLRPGIEADSLLRRPVVQVVVGGVHVCLDVSENGLPILTREAHGREASRHGATTIVT